MSSRGLTAALLVLSGSWFAAAYTALRAAPAEPRAPRQTTTSTQPFSSPAAGVDAAAVVQKYCVSCHNQRLKTAGLVLEGVDAAAPSANPELWERVIVRLSARSMPPRGSPRPDETTYHALSGWLEGEIDRAWLARPNPGRINAVHRLNRTEYSNAIRDLFALDPLSIDVQSLLPGDETADGSFDNFADVLSISTAHLERYLSAARQVTRLAVGLPPASSGASIFEIPLHVVQDDRQSEDLPFGSRGGLAIRYHFPVDGEYLFKVRLRRQYQDYIMGMGWPQELDVRLDGKLLQRFTVGGKAPGRPAAASYAGDGEPGFAGGPEWEAYMQLTADAGLEVRVRATAGTHIVGVSFVRELWEPEGLPQPLQRGRVLTNDQIYMDHAAVGSVQILGPYGGVTPAQDTASRRAIFVCTPDGKAEAACAKTILSRMARLAYRRPVTDADLRTLLGFFDTGRRDGNSFDDGIQFALERMLVDPDFLLRLYRDPPGPPQFAYRLSDLELASRLSFFLWSSIPDERLLELAEQRRLARPEVLEQEVRRMLADPRTIDSLVGDFTGQWLNLRRLTEVVVHPDFYPNFDDNLLQGFRRETEMFVASTVREDRSVLDLLRADYTFVNERLARHYGLPGIYGTRFRRITLPDPEQRGGLLAHGSILAATSYPDRTSPVLRGKYLLDNIFGVQVPPPPPGVDTTLPDVKPGAVPPTIRERLAQHRQQPVCHSCHAVIDPPGFALENFDAIGGWRTVDEAGRPVDATGELASGATIKGLSGLRAHLLASPDRFTHTLTEKLLAYAIGRRLEYYDRPAIRQIVRDAAASDYRWSSILMGIVKSPTFQRRASGARGTN